MIDKTISRMLAGGVVALLCLPLPAAADSLTIRAEPPDAEKRAASNARWDVFLEGEFDIGAAERVRQEMAQVGDNGADVYLDSPGGSLQEGVLIGHLLRNTGATTTIGRRGRSGIEPGKCLSACSMAFLGGVYRSVPDGSLFGVHRAYTAVRTNQDFDAGQILAAQIQGYIREMGVDSRLFTLMASVGKDRIYVLSPAELQSLRVVNDGKKPAQWTSEISAHGPNLIGSQQSASGTGKAIFGCDKGVVVMRSIYQAGTIAATIKTGQWIHSLAIDNTSLPLETPKAIEDVNGYLNATFALAPDQVRRIEAASSVGHLMSGGRGDPASLGYKIDIDADAAKKVGGFMESCTGSH